LLDAVIASCREVLGEVDGIATGEKMKLKALFKSLKGLI
jgi:hypothetical protein